MPRCDRCAARVLRRFAPWNEKLYAQMARTRKENLAPPYEPHFPPFSAPDCASVEKTMADLNHEELATHMRSSRRRDPTSAEELHQFSPAISPL